MTDTKRQDAIRDRAHSLWEQDGRPDGKDAEHWTRAEAEYDAEATPEAGGDEAMEGSIAGTDAAKPAKAPRKRAKTGDAAGEPQA